MTLTHKERRYVEILVRRARHLENRISSSEKRFTYDEHELAALKWAVERITGMRYEDIP